MIAKWNNKCMGIYILTLALIYAQHLVIGKPIVDKHLINGNTADAGSINYDHDNNVMRSRRSLQVIDEDGVWQKNHLTYKINRYATTVARKIAQIDKAFRKATRAWSDVANITFSQLIDSTISQSADVNVYFDLYDFDTNCPSRYESPVLACTVLYAGRMSKDMHFNGHYIWTDDFIDDNNALPDNYLDLLKRRRDLVDVAVHEIGHVLGLTDTNDTQTIMTSWLETPYRWSENGLGEKDIENVQRLYGPNPSYGSHNQQLIWKPSQEDLSRLRQMTERTLAERTLAERIAIQMREQIRSKDLTPELTVNHGSSALTTRVIAGVIVFTISLIISLGLYNRKRKMRTTNGAVACEPINQDYILSALNYPINKDI